MELSYQDLIKKLDRIYEKDGENEYILRKIESTGQQIKLVALETKKVKETIKNLEKSIISDQKEAEKSIRNFGIVFSPKYLVFLRLRDEILQKPIVQKLKKKLDKVSLTFKKKYKAFLKNPGDMASWDKLFDRSDLIDEFYKLYSKAKENLLNNIQGIHDDIKKEEFTDNLLMQILIIWYLQEKRFLNNDRNYLINRFKDFRSLGYKSYYIFLQGLFEIMMGAPTNEIFNEHTKMGNIIVTGTAPFINGELGNVQIPDKVFYLEGETEFLKKTDPKNLSTIPILNLFESRDWTKGNIDEFVLGAIYEKLITMDKRKRTGAFYTPEEITTYMSKSSINVFLTEKINEHFKNDYNTVEEILDSKNEKTLIELFKILKNIKICDPAVGSGHFLEKTIEYLLKIYQRIKDALVEMGFNKGLNIKIIGNKNKVRTIDLLDNKDEDLFSLYIKFYIILSRNIYGVDINPSALKIAKARLFLSLAKHFDVNKNYFIQFPNVHFNLRVGNSLVGFTKYERPSEQSSITLFSKKDEVKIISKKLELVSDLKDYLKIIAAELEIQIDIIEYINYINDILIKKNINSKDFRRILIFKANLVKILIASLESQYALKINDFLNQLNNLFNSKFDNEYSIKNSIELEDLRDIKTFHWILEFPEVFLGRKGFDIIIGNPPYLSFKSSKADKDNSIIDFITKKYEDIEDLYEAFIIRSKQICKGKTCLIVPYSFYRQIGRTMIKNLITYDNLGENIFIGVRNAVCIILFDNEKHSSFSFRTYLFMEDKKQRLGKINCEETSSFEFYENNPIIKYINSVSKNYHHYNIEITRGEEYGRKVLLNNIYNNNQPIFTANEMNPFILSKPTYYIEKNRIEKDFYNNVKIGVNLAFRNRIKATYIGRSITLKSIINIYNTSKSNLMEILGFWNSKLFDWYHNTRYCIFEERRVNTIRNIREEYPIILDNNSKISEIVKYLIISPKNKNLQKILDLMIYELYFYKKFYEDKIYSKNNKLLIEAVSPYLFIFNFEQYEDLFFKYLLETLDENAIDEFNKIKHELKEKIKTFCISIEKDEIIKQIMYKILSHPWIIKIESFMKRY